METPNLDRALREANDRDGIDSTRWTGLKKAPGLRSRFVAALFAWANPFAHANLYREYDYIQRRCAELRDTNADLRAVNERVERSLKDDFFMNMKKHREQELVRSLSEEYEKFCAVHRFLVPTFEEFSRMRERRHSSDAKDFVTFIRKAGGADIAGIDIRASFDFNGTLHFRYRVPEMDYAWVFSDYPAQR